MSLPLCCCRTDYSVCTARYASPGQSVDTVCIVQKIPSLYGDDRHEPSKTTARSKAAVPLLNKKKETKFSTATILPQDYVGPGGMALHTTTDIDDVSGALSKVVWSVQQGSGKPSPNNDCSSNFDQNPRVSSDVQSDR